jgi:hypothetical protein
LSHGRGDYAQDFLELIGVVTVSFILPVKKLELSIPGNQHGNSDLPQPTFPVLVFTSLSEFRVGVSGHVVAVVGSIEKETIGIHLLDLANPLEEK